MLLAFSDADVLSAEQEVLSKVKAPGVHTP